MKYPFISICIPSYQRIIYLIRLLDSIAIQNFKSFEVILSDDSRDNSVENLVKKYGKEQLIPENIVPPVPGVYEPVGPTTLYSGLPIDKLLPSAETIQKGKQLLNRITPSEEFIEKGKGLFKSSGRLGEVYEPYYYAERGVESAAMHGQQVYNEIQGNLNLIFKDREVLNKQYSSKVVEDTNNLLNNTRNVLVDTPEGKKLLFDGFKGNARDLYVTKLKSYGLEDNEINKLIKNVEDTRHSINGYFNEVINPENMDEALVHYDQLMKKYANSYLNSEYKIFHTDNQSLIFGNTFKATDESTKEIRNIITKNAEESGIVLSEADKDFIMRDISQASLDSKTNAPVFETKNIPIKPLSKIESDLSITKIPTEIKVNLSKMVDGEGNFYANGIIRNKEQLEAFQKYFRAMPNVSRSAYNLITDAGTYAARTRMLSDIKRINNLRIANGKIPLFVEGDKLEARNIFSKFGKDKVFEYIPQDFKYISPFGGGKRIWMPSQDLVDAMDLAYKLPMQDAYKSTVFSKFFGPINSYMSAKSTVLSAPRESLNFFQYGTDTFALGNLFKDHAKLFEGFKKDLMEFKNLRPEQLKQKGAFQTAFSSITKNLPDDQFLMRFFNSYGIGMSHPTVKNLEAMFKNSTIFKNLAEGKVPTFEMGGKKFFRVAKDSYMAVDNAFKMLNAVAEYDGLKQAYMKAVANGTWKEMPNFEFLWKKAAETIQDTLPNYQKALEGVRAYSQFPVLGNFIMWPSEKWRNVYKGVEISLKQMSGGLDHPEFGIGARRLAMMTAVYGGLLSGGGAFVYNRLMNNFGSRKEGAVRQLVNDYEKYHSLLFVDKDKYGRTGYIDFDHFNSISNVSTLLNSVFASVNDEEFRNPNNPKYFNSVMVGLGESILNTTESYRDPKLATQLLLDLYKGETPEGKKIWLDGDSDKWEKAIAYIAKGVLPPGDWFKRMYLATTNKPDDRGQKYNFLDEAATPFGLRIKRIDPIQKFDSSMGAYKKGISDVDETIKDFNKQIGNTPNDVIKFLFDASDKKYDLLSDLRNKYLASRYLGASEDKIYEHQNSNKTILGYLEDNLMQPIDTYARGIQRYLDKEHELKTKYNFGEGLKIPNEDSLLDRIDALNERISNIRLGRGKLRDIIDINKYLFKPTVIPKTAPISSTVPPLPQQPGPNAQVIPQTVNTGNQNYTKADEAKILNV